MKRISWLILFCIPCMVGTAAYSQYVKNDWKERDAWMDYAKLFQFAKINTGSAVADVGCYEGYLSVRLAKSVGETGKVYAVDVREDRIKALKKNMVSEKLSNIEAILGDTDDPKLPLKELDAVFVIDTYHEIDDYMTMLAHIRSALKNGGRIVVLEKLKEHAKNESREIQAASHTLSLHYVKKELLASGFKIIREVDDFGIWNQEEDKTMWVLVGVKDSNK